VEQRGDSGQPPGATGVIFLRVADMEVIATRPGGAHDRHCPAAYGDLVHWGGCHAGPIEGAAPSGVREIGEVEQWRYQVIPVAFQDSEEVLVGAGWSYRDVDLCPGTARLPKP
jgi:hypothetical protein